MDAKQSVVVVKGTRKAEDIYNNSNNEEFFNNIQFFMLELEKSRARL